jgi:antagonist of KipI
MSSSSRSRDVAEVRVLRPGLLTTVQDTGRWGAQSRGVPPAGPMDPWSHRLANALVGNAADAATLEVTLKGPELEFADERITAVAGAQFAIDVDGKGQSPNTAFIVPAGARLRVGARRIGARGYLAVAGGFAVPEVLGSRATHLVSRLGGLEGRALAAGDSLPLGVPGGPKPRLGGEAALPESGRPTRVRVLPGPHADKFSPDALSALQSAPYTLGTDSDRMGFRLNGPRLSHANGADIISDVTPLGVLQVPASGQPVLLMADRQTTGGYAILATVISADIGLAGQLVPGDQIQFAACTLQEAMAALIRQEQALLAIEAGRLA